MLVSRLIPAIIGALLAGIALGMLFPKVRASVFALIGSCLGATALAHFVGEISLIDSLTASAVILASGVVGSTLGTLWRRCRDRRQV